METTTNTASTITRSDNKFSATRQYFSTQAPLWAMHFCQQWIRNLHVALIKICTSRGDSAAKKCSGCSFFLPGGIQFHPSSIHPSMSDCLSVRLPLCCCLSYGNKMEWNIGRKVQPLQPSANIHLWRHGPTSYNRRHCFRSTPGTFFQMLGFLIPHLLETDLQKMWLQVLISMFGPTEGSWSGEGSPAISERFRSPKCAPQKNADCSLCLPHTVIVLFSLAWSLVIGFSFGRSISASAKFQILLSFISQHLPYTYIYKIHTQSLYKNTALNHIFVKLASYVVVNNEI